MRTPEVSNTLDELKRVLEQHFYNPDVEAVQATLAAVAAHRLTGQPVWLMLVAPPGSMKTEILRALQGVPLVYSLDSVTPRTFLSGQIFRGRRSRGRTSSSLLHRIGASGILTFPDFSTVLSMKRDERGQVFADLRRIYDGRLNKEFGTDEVIQPWEGRITVLAAATPDVDAKYSVFQSLGERFLMVREPRAGRDAATKAMRQEPNVVRQALKEAVHAVLNLLGQSPSPPSVSEAQDSRFSALADFVARARTPVARNGYTKELTYLPEAESPTRLAQQFAQLAKGSALLNGHDEVGDAEWRIVRRVALDSIPALRRRVLAQCTGVEVSVPKSTASSISDDLELHGLVDESKHVSELCRTLLGDAGLSVHDLCPPGQSGGNGSQ